MSRLPAALEAASLVRRAEIAGDFATVIRKGDPDRGALMLVITSRGRHSGCLERILVLESGNYVWQRSGPDEGAGAAEVGEFLDRRVRGDEDLWLIELDIADPERFIAETTSQG